MNVPRYVVITVIMAAANYIIIKGVISMWKNPPSSMFMLGVIFIGILLGVFMSIIQPSYEEYEKNMGEDKRDN